MNYDTIVLSGGGLKGWSQVSSLHYMVENELLKLDNIKTYAGTSVGSAICLLLICGYTPIEIFQYLYTHEEKDTPYINIFELFNTYGLIDISVVLKPLEDMILKKLKYIPTFEDIKIKLGKDFTVTGTNVTKMSIQYFNYTNTPNMSSLDAVKISCCFPLIFHKIEYNYDYYVDGAILDNFPIDEIYSKDKIILGIYTSNKRAPSNVDSDDTFTNYIMRLWWTVIYNSALYKFECSRKSNVNIMNLEIKYVSLLNPSLSSKEKMELFLEGYNQVKILSKRVYIRVEGYDDDCDTTTNISTDGWNTWENFSI